MKTDLQTLRLLASAAIALSVTLSTPAFARDKIVIADTTKFTVEKSTVAVIAPTIITRPVVTPVVPPVVPAAIPPVVQPIVPATTQNTIPATDHHAIDAITQATLSSTQHISVINAIDASSKNMVLSFDSAIPQAGNGALQQHLAVATIDPNGDGLLTYSVSDMTIVESLSGGSVMAKDQAKEIMNRVYDQIIAVDNRKS